MGSSLELVMLLSFMVDGLLLLGTNRLAGHPPGWGRCALAALVGGVYGGACLIPGFSFLGNSLWRLVSLGIMGGIAFGLEKSGYRRSGLFVLLNLALGGMAMGMGAVNLPALMLCAGVIWLLCRIGFGGGGGRECIPLELRYEDRLVRLTALRDSGNSLRDPITGEKVLVIGADAAEKLTGLTRMQLEDPLDTVAKRSLPGLRLIPYRAVGQPAGLLLALRLKNVQVGDRRETAVVAFAPERIGIHEGFQALMGGF